MQVACLTFDVYCCHTYLVFRYVYFFICTYVGLSDILSQNQGLHLIVFLRPYNLVKNSFLGYSV